MIITKITPSESIISYILGQYLKQWVDGFPPSDLLDFLLIQPVVSELTTLEKCTIEACKVLIAGDYGKIDTSLGVFDLGLKASKKEGIRITNNVRKILTRLGNYPINKWVRIEFLYGNHRPTSRLNKEKSQD